jgi:hypothetical protein
VRFDAAERFDWLGGEPFVGWVAKAENVPFASSYLVVKQRSCKSLFALEFALLYTGERRFVVIVVEGNKSEIALLSPW